MCVHVYVKEFEFNNLIERDKIKTKAVTDKAKSTEKKLRQSSLTDRQVNYSQFVFSYCRPQQRGAASPREKKPGASGLRAA